MDTSHGRHPDVDLRHTKVVELDHHPARGRGHQEELEVSSSTLLLAPERCPDRPPLDLIACQKGDHVPACEGRGGEAPAVLAHCVGKVSLGTTRRADLRECGGAVAGRNGYDDPSDNGDDVGREHHAGLPARHPPSITASIETAAHPHLFYYTPGWADEAGAPLPRVMADRY